MRFAMRPAWAAILALLGIELVTAQATRLTIDWSGWALPLALVATLLLAGAAYARRAPAIAQAFRVMALWLAFILTSIVFSYCCLRLPAPTRDAGFARVDHMLGFDWLAWRGVIDRHAWLRPPLQLAYGSLIPQAALYGLFVVLARDDRRQASQRRLSEFFWIALLAAVVTSLIGGLMPALGVPLAYGIEPPWLPDLLALRAAGPITVATGSMKGLISFPSYHTVQALLLAYSARGLGWRSLVVAAVNAVMLVSTLSEGGHYLVDVLGGIAVFLVCLAVVRAAHEPLAAARALGACLPRRHAPAARGADEETVWLTRSGHEPSSLGRSSPSV